MTQNHTHISLEVERNVALNIVNCLFSNIVVLLYYNVTKLGL